MIHSVRIPARALLPPAALVRALRSALRMSQTHLARRCGIPRPHLTLLEAGTVDIRLSTLHRLLDAMFCDLVILPLPRKRPSDALAERECERLPNRRAWD